MPHADESVGIWIRQRPDQYGIDDTKDGGGRSDTECQRQDRGKREARALADHPERDAEVVRQSLDPADVVRLVRVLTNAQCIAELTLCGEASIVE